MLAGHGQPHHRGHAAVPECPHRLRRRAQRLLSTTSPRVRCTSSPGSGSTPRSCMPCCRSSSCWLRSSRVCFDPLLRPLNKRIAGLLDLQHAGSDGLTARIRVLQAAGRQGGECFPTVAGALAQRRQLRLRYFNRGDDSRSERAVSPQRLTYYRDNWYLDAWCHLREGLRTFALDAIEEARGPRRPGAGRARSRAGRPLRRLLRDLRRCAQPSRRPAVCRPAGPLGRQGALASRPGGAGPVGWPLRAAGALQQYPGASDGHPQVRAGRGGGGAGGVARRGGRPPRLAALALYPDAGLSP